MKKQPQDFYLKGKFFFGLIWIIFTKEKCSANSVQRQMGGLTINMELCMISYLYKYLINDDVLQSFRKLGNNLDVNQGLGFSGFFCFCFFLAGEKWKISLWNLSPVQISCTEKKTRQIKNRPIWVKFLVAHFMSAYMIFAQMYSDSWKSIIIFSRGRVR